VEPKISSCASRLGAEEGKTPLMAEPEAPSSTLPNKKRLSCCRTAPGQRIPEENTYHTPPFAPNEANQTLRPTLFGRLNAAPQTSKLKIAV